MKTKKAFPLSKKKPTSSHKLPKAIHRATKRPRKLDSRSKKKQIKHTRKVAVISPKAEKREPKQDFSKYEKKLDYLSGKIDELVTSVNSFKRSQTTSFSHNQANTLDENSTAKEESADLSRTNTASEQFTQREEVPVAKFTSEQARFRQELDRLSREEVSAKARLAKLNSEFEEIQGKVDALHKYYITQNQSLDGELEARRKAVHQRIEDERTAAEAEVMQLLRQRDESRDLVRNLSQEKDSLRKEVEFARSLSALIRNPDSVKEADLAILSEKFEQARLTRKVVRNSANSKARIAWQQLLSAIADLSKT